MRKQHVDIEPAVRGRVWRQAADRLRKLAFGADLPASTCLVPRYGDVHEPLKEVAFLARRGTPCKLELLVRGEVLAASDQLKPCSVP